MKLSINTDRLNKQCGVQARQDKVEDGAAREIIQLAKAHIDGNCRGDPQLKRCLQGCGISYKQAGELVKDDGKLSVVVEVMESALKSCSLSSSSTVSQPQLFIQAEAKAKEVRKTLAKPDEKSKSQTKQPVKHQSPATSRAGFRRLAVPSTRRSATRRTQGKQLSFHDTDWSKVSHMKTSAGGVSGGVWFVTGPPGSNEHLVVKSVFSAQEECFCAQFIGVMGVSTPEARFISGKSDEMQKICDMSEKLEKDEKLDCSRGTVFRPRTPIHQSKNPCIVMERVQGSTLSEVGKAGSNGVAAYKDTVATAKFAQQLGRIFICDRILNNSDRFGDFDKTTMNLGNIMVNENGLMAIDTGALLPRNNASALEAYQDRLREEVTRLFSSDSSESHKYAEIIAKGLQPLEIDPNEIARGMRDAVKDIAQNKDKYIRELKAVAAETAKEAKLGKYDDTVQRSLNKEPSLLDAISRNLIIISEAYPRGGRK